MALVTGATSGIGRASAVALAQAGAQMVVTGRREAEGQQTVALVEAAGGEGFFVAGDVSDARQNAAVVSAAVERFGRLDIAVNNAGTESPAGLMQATKEDFTRVYGINVWGVLSAMQAQIPAMLHSGDGSIVNVSSVLGLKAIPESTLYTSSKHAVIGLTRSAALEYARQGVRINAIAPGLIETPMVDRFAGRGSDTHRQIIEGHPIGRSGQPEEVASAVVWLASEAASFVTGAVFAIDGGLMAQ